MSLSARCPRCGETVSISGEQLIVGATKYGECICGNPWRLNSKKDEWTGEYNGIIEFQGNTFSAQTVADMKERKAKFETKNNAKKKVFKSIPKLSKFIFATILPLVVSLTLAILGLIYYLPETPNFLGALEHGYLMPIILIFVPVCLVLFMTLISMEETKIAGIIFTSTSPVTLLLGIFLNNSFGNVLVMLNVIAFAVTVCIYACIAMVNNKRAFSIITQIVSILIMVICATALYLYLKDEFWSNIFAAGAICYVIFMIMRVVNSKDYRPYYY